MIFRIYLVVLIRQGPGYDDENMFRLYMGSKVVSHVWWISIYTLDHNVYFLLYNTWQQEKPSTRVVLKNGLKLRKFLFSSWYDNQSGSKMFRLYYAVLQSTGIVLPAEKCTLCIYIMKPENMISHSSFRIYLLSYMKHCYGVKWA